MNAKVKTDLLRLIAALGLATVISGCSEYWWTRGQAPSSQTLVTRASSRLDSALTERADERQQVATQAKDLRKSLLEVITSVTSKDSQKVAAALNQTKTQFLDLENTISVTSRAPYGELSKQLRAFSKQLEGSGHIDEATFKLFAARTIFFLARELHAPSSAVI